jgi:hypothetical protein
MIRGEKLLDPVDQRGRMDEKRKRGSGVKKRCSEAVLAFTTVQVKRL